MEGLQTLTKKKKSGTPISSFTYKFMIWSGSQVNIEKSHFASNCCKSEQNRMKLDPSAYLKFHEIIL